MGINCSGTSRYVTYLLYKTAGTAAKEEQIFIMQHSFKDQQRATLPKERKATVMTCQYIYKLKNKEKI